MLKQNTQLSFSEWVTQKAKLKPKTATTYNQFISKIPTDIDLINMSEEQVCGIINTALIKYPHNLALSAFKKYILYLFNNGVEPILKNKPEEFEVIRRKKNSILANIELPVVRPAKKIDVIIESKYIYADKLYSMLEKCATKVNLGIAPISNDDCLMIGTCMLTLYDTAARINEIISNKWMNVTKEGINIPWQISKSGKSRFIEWLIPETYLLLMKWKKLNNFSDDDKLFGEVNYISFYNRQVILSSFVFIESSPHYFRHTRITDLAAEGWELGRLQRRAGHSNPNQTNGYIDYVKRRGQGIMSLEAWMKKNNKDLKFLVR